MMESTQPASLPFINELQQLYEIYKKDFYFTLISKIRQRRVKELKELISDYQNMEALLKSDQRRFPIPKNDLAMETYLSRVGWVYSLN